MLKLHAINCAKSSQNETLSIAVKLCEFAHMDVRVRVNRIHLAFVFACVTLLAWHCSLQINTHIQPFFSHSRFVGVVGATTLFQANS